MDKNIQDSLERIDTMKDEDIDYSDIPELDDDFFVQESIDLKGCPICDSKPFIPNAETIAAMEEGWSGKLKSSTLETLIEDLNSDDD